MIEEKTYECRKFFRFSYTKLFDVTNQGILFNGILYRWGDVDSIKQNSFRGVHIGIIEFYDGTKCTFNLNTFRQKGQQTNFLFGVNSDFNHLIKIYYDQVISVLDSKKSEERNRNIHKLMDNMLREKDPLKLEELIKEFDLIANKDIEGFHSTLNNLKVRAKNK